MSASTSRETAARTLRRRVGYVRGAGKAILPRGSGYRGAEHVAEGVDGGPVVLQVVALAYFGVSTIREARNFVPPNRLTPSGVAFQCMYSFAQAW